MLQEIKNRYSIDEQILSQLLAVAQKSTLPFVTIDELLKAVQQDVQLIVEEPKENVAVLDEMPVEDKPKTTKSKTKTNS